MLITAELGINHNGDLEVAEKMIKEAAHAGAHVVKFQKRDVDAVYTQEELAREVDSPWGKTLGAKVRGREFDWDQYRHLIGIIHRYKLRFAASCWDIGTLEDLDRRFGDCVAYHKVASAQVHNERFLKTVASMGKLVVVSTGLCRDLEDIRRVARVFEARKCKYVLLHTTSLYPTPPERCHLAVIPELIREFHNWEFAQGIGYSGHERGICASVIAVVLGANWIERHFTLDRNQYGADQLCSLEPREFEMMATEIGLVPRMIGCRHKRLEGDEKTPETGREG